MNTSSNDTTNKDLSISVSTFFYRDMDSASTKVEQPNRADQSLVQDIEQEATANQSAESLDVIMKRAVGEAVAETEKRLAHEYEEKATVEAAKIVHALELFHDERKRYFSRVEAEIIHLALAISRKILHRETQLDPQLVAALVRMAIEKLHDGSSVSVRVAPSAVNRWTDYMSAPLNGSSVTILGDTHLGHNECILETDLGSVNFSIDAQLKEVEQGFFDLLAQMPVVK